MIRPKYVTSGTEVYTVQDAICAMQAAIKLATMANALYSSPASQATVHAMMSEAVQLSKHAFEELGCVLRAHYE